MEKGLTQPLRGGKTNDTVGGEQIFERLKERDNTHRQRRSSVVRPPQQGQDTKQHHQWERTLLQARRASLFSNEKLCVELSERQRERERERAPSMEKESKHAHASRRHVDPAASSLLSTTSRFLLFFVLNHKLSLPLASQLFHTFSIHSGCILAMLKHISYLCNPMDIQNREAA